MKQTQRRRLLPNAAEIMQLAELLYKGGLTPKGVSRPEQIAARIIAGQEVGLSAVQSVNWIMIVGGRATIWGDAALALIRASGQLELFTERLEGEDDGRIAICELKRKGETDARTETFSVDDAKKAKLWAKEGPWQDYPQRMLKMRARAWALRDGFSDILCGLAITEEMLDVPEFRKALEQSETLILPDAPAPTPTPEPAPPAVVKVGAKTLEQIALARLSWLRSQGVNPDDADAVRVRWASLMGEWNVAKAKELSADAATALLAKLRGAGHEQEKKEVFGEGATVA